MAVYQEGVKQEDPLVAATIDAGDAEAGLSVLPPVAVGQAQQQAQAGVDFGGQGSTADFGGLWDLSARVRRHLGSSADAPGRGDLGANGSPGPFRVADPAAPVFAHQAGRGTDPLGPEREPGQGWPVDFPRAGGDMLGAGIPLRPAAILAMQVGALTIISGPDAPWSNQFGGMLIWMAGCVALFLSWR